MNKSILKTGVQEFIKNNWNTDIVSVLLKKPIFEDISQKELTEQLEAKKKCKDKLPTWFTTPHIYYPNKLHIEQTSSEETAAFKASLIHGKTLLDVTGGLGVDSYFFSNKFDLVTHCELNQNLSKIALYNFEILGTKNISCIVENGIEFLDDSKNKFDWIFIDPSRRNDAKGKVFLLKDCLPDVPSNLNVIFNQTEHLMVKTSPLLDITNGISELKYVKEIYIVALKNEVKELLWILEKGFQGEPELKTVNLDTSQETFSFNWSGERNANVTLAQPEGYLYEPNASIMKSGGFKSIGNTYGLKKLHEHSHLYTSNELIAFPGRRFVIEEVVYYAKKELKKLTMVQKANITTRNFPESVATIRKKLKLKDGGAVYLFFTTDKDSKLIVLKCSKA